MCTHSQQEGGVVSQTTSHSYSSPDVIIVGAGIAGCALAHSLGTDGRKVLLIERDMSEPDRIVGEYLQPGGVEALKQMGLEECLEGIDSRISYGHAVINKEERVRLTYPSWLLKPFRKSIRVDGTVDDEVVMGRSFHHGRFIMQLRDACKRNSNISIVEGTVTDLKVSKDESKIVGVMCRLKNKPDVVLRESKFSPPLDGADDVTSPQNGTVELYAPLTIVADGCFSSFRKRIHSRDVVVKSYFVGVEMFDCPLPIPNHGHVILAHPSPVLV